MPPDLHIRVEFLGPFEMEFRSTGADVVLSAPATIGALLNLLAAREEAGEKLRRLIRDDSPRRRYCLVSLDYRALALDEVLDTPLHDGARVCFAMPMVGG